MAESELPQDPRSVFGGLFSVCVRDDYAKDKGFLAEGVLLVILGAASSFVTTYVLSVAGVLL